MKASTIVTLLLSASTSVNSFTMIQQAKQRTTSLQYTVFAGIEEEDTKDIEQIRPTKEKKDHGGHYSVDRDLNVDAYSLGAAGGIIPGIQLTALCGDD